MKSQQVESTPEEERGRETVAYPARNREELEQIIEQAHTVDNEETAEAVESINGVVDDELRGVVRNHFEAPIRSLTNPQENTVELEDGTNAQVVGEEYFVNQNLPGFQDVGNIKWWTIYDEGTYREETRNDRSGEHLQFNSDGDLHGFHVELDGETLNPEQTRRLARNLRIRRDNQVVTENRVPEIMLEYDSLEEATSSFVPSSDTDEQLLDDIDLDNPNDDMLEMLQETGSVEQEITREDFESEYEEAQELGLVTEGGNLTLKGWLSATDMEARDVRAIEDVARGNNTVEFESNGDLGFGLKPLSIRGRASVEASNQYISSRRLRNPAEEGEIELEENEYSDNLSAFLSEYSWIGFNPESDPTEPQNVEEEITLARYLKEFENAEIDKVDEESFRVNREDIRNRIFSQLNDVATGWDEGVTITDAEVSYNTELEIMDYSGEEVEDISAEDSEIPTEILNEIQTQVEDSLNFKSGSMLFATSNLGTVGGDERFDRWDKVFRHDDGLSTEFEKEKRCPDSVTSLLLKSRHGEEITELQEGYDASGRGTYIPFFDEASDSVMETVEELEELGWVETEVVEENPAEIDITAGELGYRETVEKLEDIEALSFNKTERVAGRNHNKHRVPLDSVKAEFEVKSGKEDEVEKRLKEYEEELEDHIYMPTRREVKDSIVPQFKKYVHEELDSKSIGRILGKVVSEPGYSDRETVNDYEELSGLINYAELKEDEEGNATGFDKCLSEELLNELGEMYKEGLIEAELEYDTETDSEYESDRIEIPGEATIRNYRELDEETKDELRELDQRGLISLDESDYHLELQTSGRVNDDWVTYEPQERISLSITGEAEATELEVEDEPVELEGEYSTTDDTIYKPNNGLRKVAENLDPLNSEKECYDNVEIETDFEYNKARQPAVV